MTDRGLLRGVAKAIPRAVVGMPPPRRLLEHGSSGRVSPETGGQATTSAESAPTDAPSSSSTRPRTGTSNGCSLAPGDLIAGEFRIEKQLGSGTQSTVWLVSDPETREMRALKLFNKVGDEHGREEAWRLLSLTHPEIVRLYRVVEHHGHIGLLMDYLEGGSLGKLLDDRPDGLPAEECLSVLRGVAPALDHAHGSGITHHDIKLENLMLAELPKSGLNPKHLRICDFGLSSVMGPAGSRAACGTPAYWAPEIHRCEPATLRSDLFSLAVTLFYLNTGRLPFGKCDLREIYMRKVRRDGPPHPHSGNRAFDRAIMRALSRRPEDRFDSFDEFLYAASGGLQGSRAPARTPVRMLCLASSTALVLAVGVVQLIVPVGDVRATFEQALPLEGAPVALAEGQPAYVTRQAHHEWVFDLNDRRRATVDVAFEGRPAQTFTRAAGEPFRAEVPIPAEGVHRLQVLVEDRVVGSLTVELDGTVQDPELAPLVSGPFHDLAEPLFIEVGNESDVKQLFSLDSPRPSEAKKIENGAFQFEGSLLNFGSTGQNSWTKKLRFRVLDEHGNQATFEVSVRMRDRATILEKYEQSFERLGLDTSNPRAIRDSHRNLTDWRSNFRPPELTDEEKETFLESIGFVDVFQEVSLLREQLPSQSLTVLGTLGEGRLDTCMGEDSLIVRSRTRSWSFGPGCTLIVEVHDPVHEHLRCFDDEGTQLAVAKIYVSRDDPTIGKSRIALTFPSGHPAPTYLRFASNWPPEAEVETTLRLIVEE